MIPFSVPTKNRKDATWRSKITGLKTAAPLNPAEEDADAFVDDVPQWTT